MTTLGVLVGSRGIFPSDLCERGRKTVLTVLKEEDIDAVALTLKDTASGSVESRADAARCAELFKANRDRIDGIVVTLPNFGDERGVADALRMAGLDVPVLVHAFPDEQGRLGIEQRRDSFCGKLSLCNALSQYAIRYTLTSRHAMDPEGEDFREDLRRFAAVCRVTRALRHARFGQIGTRPSTFVTVRYSEKLLERAGISVEPIDLSEVIGRATALRDKDSTVLSKLDEITDYVKTTKIPRESLLRMARLAVVLDQYMAERGLAGTAIQCWSSIEENFGVAPCVVMSMLSNALQPSACETDIAGLVGMYAMVQASGKPSAIASWNNNNGDEQDECVLFHCGAFPQDLLMKKGVMSRQELLAGVLDREKTYGTIVGRLRPTELTYCRVSTDDASGRIRAYVGEAEITKSPVVTYGAAGIARVPRLEQLLRWICRNGFEHQVAINPSRLAAVLEESFSRYLGWDVYNHDNENRA